MTPLHYIADRNYQELEKEILRLGARTNDEDEQGLTPLQKVFIKNNLSIERFTLYVRHGADLNKTFTVTYKIGKDEFKKKYTLLIYAVEKGQSYFEDELLRYKADASIENEEGKSAFDIAITQVTHELTLQRLRLYTLSKANVRKQNSVKIRGRTMNVSPILYFLNHPKKNDYVDLIQGFIEAGVSVNDGDADGWTPIIYAIRRNSMPLLQRFLVAPNLDRNMRDKQGKTPIHHVINPMDYASYENVQMLEMLARVFDINAVDDRKKPPVYYAHFQDSGTMLNALLKLGANDHKPAAELQRQATSIIAGVDWREEIDYETDAEKFIAEEESKQMDDATVEKIPVDKSAHQRQNLEVVYDEKLGPYSLYMTKVNIDKGMYGEYLFYRMQLLHDTNRDNYLVFTKWGRIGDDGMFQMTPFPSLEECVKEFCKIFKDKSGNEWEKKDEFQKVPKKYKLLNISTKRNQRDYLQPVDWKDKKLPESTLVKPTKEVIKMISDVKLFRNYFGKHNIDSHILPFGKLTKDLIFEAKQILLELKELIEEISMKPQTTEEEIQAVFKLKEGLVDRSNRFYELIPDKRFHTSPIKPIDNVHTLEEKVNMVNDMLDFEVSSKILLGALLLKYEKNPIDYCFEALNIRLLPLTKQQREHKLITQYVKNGYPGFNDNQIERIFALERRGEAERISQWKGLKNRTYLWHGSKLLNFMGILSQGLRIAPPEAPATGYMFGKGIYFADTLAKSYGYCHDYRGGNNSKLLILCEVALGESMERFEADYVTTLPPQYKSVKGCGRVGPDPTQNIVLANGAIVPIGKQMTYQYYNIMGQARNPVLNYNEYIVYDISQVRMRYLVQLK